METPTIRVALVIKPLAVGVPVVSTFAKGSSSSATEIVAVVVRYQISTSEKTTKRKREGENLLQQIEPREGLEVVKDLMVDDDAEVGKEVKLKAILSEYGGDLLESIYLLASSDQTTDVSVEEQPMEVTKTEDEDCQSAYLPASAEQANAKSIEEQITEVVKTEDEASQTKESKENVEQSKEEVVEGKDDDDRN
ncbi:hypothetical protein GIB67_020981 [Kingdonia uniflora]|uniref:Uncharacterized protein n=1 Tax=Kingdonia uniflora TaxID=39325 RepID=A0A7J7M823_9MAGN|nr:hypothetical protein GIB67_020981 [Kingdonia uniflora]